MFRKAIIVVLLGFTAVSLVVAFRHHTQNLYPVGHFAKTHGTRMSFSRPPSIGRLHFLIVPTFLPRISDEEFMLHSPGSAKNPHARGPWPPTLNVLWIPAWLPAAFFGAYPTWRLIYRYRHRHKPGHCACGYDLTGNESGVCPECGRNLHT